MATANDVIESGKWDLRAKVGKPYEDEELLEYLNRALIWLDSSLISKGSDWLKKTDAVSSISTGQRKLTMPTRCVGIDSIWRSDVLASYTDLTFTSSTIKSAASNFATGGFAAGDIIGIDGSTSNDTLTIGLLSISTITDDGATNNLITTNESTMTAGGAGAGVGTIIKVKSEQVHKKDYKRMMHDRKWLSSGAPDYWAWEGTSVIFDRIADADYGLVIHFMQKSDTLTPISSMPYNDEFNEQLRQGMVMIAENKYEENANLTIALERMFKNAASTKALRRSYTPRRSTLDF